MQIKQTTAVLVDKTLGLNNPLLRGPRSSLAPKGLLLALFPPVRPHLDCPPGLP